ncbi:actin family protein [Cryptosporidium muris RN66]|uniref:Actin family protein n=1 Tax=Cryptosporidium muris (strain RN66) TaxID=441375 RepID=B6A9U7_CRYMR|nr:actin family protein [Cryptosporidium muris RN66]EEA04988.1 actin family protein [Cryptosporidium muris RN66]|eukprot:XP_002139337.1 actin family protein [Cryptosporidium muris RN66]
MSKIVVVDNGSFSIKAGFAGEPLPRVCLPNCIGKVRRRERIYTCDQIYTLNEYFSHHPFSEGLLIDTALQSDIWKYTFNKLNINPLECTILVTEPFLNPTPLQHSLSELIFEDFQFESAIISTCPQLIPFAFTPIQIPNATSEQDINPCYLVLDCGYQCCNSVPMYQGTPIESGCRRLDIGGYYLDLLLKNFLAYRQIDLSQNAFLVSKIKEIACYVSTDFEKDLLQFSSDKHGDRSLDHWVKLPEPSSSLSKSSQFYNEECIAPDPNEFISELPEELVGIQGMYNKGMKMSQTQFVKLSTERITIPEILFRPSDAGFNMEGISEMVVTSIKSCPIHLQPLLASNILVSGGSSKFRNFHTRLQMDLTQMLPSGWEVNVRKADVNPQYVAWSGASIWSSSPGFMGYTTSRRQYHEAGKN